MPRARMLAPPSLSHTPRFLTVATADSATPVATVEPAAALATAALAAALAAAEPGAADATDPRRQRRPPCRRGRAAAPEKFRWQRGKQ